MPFGPSPGLRKGYCPVSIRAVRENRTKQGAIMFNATKIFTRAIMLCAFLPLLAACATGPTFADLHATEPAVSADVGRIYLYRTAPFLGGGAAVQPAIKVDGVKVGDAVPGGYLYIDKPAGTYKISTATETEESVDLTVAPGDTRYVRFDISLGLLIGHVSPSIIDPQQGAKEIKECHFTGAVSQN